MQDTRLEPDMPPLLWSLTNVFHTATARIERELDKNEAAQKVAQKEQDGSEVKSVELERLIAEGLSTIERRNTMEVFRDIAAEAFEHHVGSAWLPKAGSKVNHRALTAAVIDSRDFIAAQKHREQTIFIPIGTRIAFSGGLDYNDHHAVWAALDKTREKFPDMVLLHGGSPKGAEHIASLWARNRGVTEVAFMPDWNKDQRAAPFKRNDRMLNQLPSGVIVFPGSGVQENLADKARKLGIKVWKVKEGGA
ncbi:DUF2493 domain-containing protein [uncultured Bartonella sp.]|uniref:DUF2493 domain-containing protein n=1 Tax=uncultured Bartonella sp. TaxID=104108 RepID=UPI00342A0A42